MGCGCQVTQLHGRQLHLFCGAACKLPWLQWTAAGGWVLCSCGNCGSGHCSGLRHPGSACFSVIRGGGQTYTSWRYVQQRGEPNGWGLRRCLASELRLIAGPVWSHVFCSATVLGVVHAQWARCAALLCCQISGAYTRALVVLHRLLSN
jgi:hypothetical protein